MDPRGVLQGHLRARNPRAWGPLSSCVSVGISPFLLLNSRNPFSVFMKEGGAERVCCIWQGTFISLNRTVLYVTVCVSCSLSPPQPILEQQAVLCGAGAGEEEKSC